MMRKRFFGFRTVFAALLLLTGTFLTASPVEAQERKPKPLAFEEAYSEGPVYVVPKLWQLKQIEDRDSDFIPIKVR